MHSATLAAKKDVQKHQGLQEKYTNVVTKNKK